MNTFYYISSGSLNKMHTLRQCFPETIVVEGENIEILRDYYITNLSTDWNNAVEKASDMVGDSLNVSKSFSLEQIERRNAEEMEAAKKAQDLKDNELILENERRMHDRNEAQIMIIISGKFPFGKFSGCEFDKADESYIQYMGKLDINKDDIANTVILFLQNVLRVKFPDLFKRLPTANGEYFGTPKQRLEMTGTVIEQFSFDGYYDTTTVIKMVKDSGELLVYMGSAPPMIDGSERLSVGQVYTFTATLDHSEYNDERQTRIKRIAKIRKV